ncbi:MAG: MotA/TolQ/ExbB proton channel family protein [Polyangiales bacterium]
MNFSLPALWEATGPFAKAIVVTMLLMWLVSVFVTCERLVVFVRSKRASMRYARGVGESLQKGQASAVAADGGDIGYLGRVIEAGLTAFRTAGSRDEHFTVETVARALERQSQLEIQGLRRGQGILGTVSSTAPFVGLLGTVVGIVTAFEQMAATGSGGLASVSSGIAEALVTTAIGLLVAIPAVFAFNFLQGWVDARAIEIAASSNEFLDYVARQIHRDGSAATTGSAAPFPRSGVTSGIESGIELSHGVRR